MGADTQTPPPGFWRARRSLSEPRQAGRRRPNRAACPSGGSDAGGGGGGRARRSRRRWAGFSRSQNGGGRSQNGGGFFRMGERPRMMGTSSNDGVGGCSRVVDSRRAGRVKKGTRLDRRFRDAQVAAVRELPGVRGHLPKRDDGLFLRQRRLRGGGFSALVLLIPPGGGAACGNQNVDAPGLQPTAPASAMFSSMRRFISTAYSMGSSLTIGSMKPATTIEVASSSVRPLLIR